MKKKNELGYDDIWGINDLALLPFIQNIPIEVTTNQPYASPAPVSNKESRSEQPVASQPIQPQNNSLARKSIKSFSIKGSINKKEEEIKQEEERLMALSQNKEFTQEELIRCWNNFIKGLTEKQILKNTMMSCKPQLEEDFKITVHVDNSVQKEQLEVEMVTLTNHLRENLKNGKIEIVIHVNEMGESIKTKTTYELFMELKETSSDFAKFAEQLKLEVE